MALLTEPFADEFIFEAKLATYACENSKRVQLPDNKRGLAYRRGEFSYLDAYQNDDSSRAPFSGLEIVRKHDEVIWRLEYSGQLTSAAKDLSLQASDVYRGLRIALRHIPYEFPVRGPKRLSIPVPASAVKQFEYLFEMDSSALQTGESRIGKERISCSRFTVYDFNCTLRSA